MRRRRGLTLLELMLSLTLLGVVTAVTFPTILHTTRAARAADARMDDAVALSAARRRVAADLRAAETVTAHDGVLVLSIDGADVRWSAGDGGLVRTAGTAEVVSRAVHRMVPRIEGDLVRVELGAATAARTLTVARPDGGTR